MIRAEATAIIIGTLLIMANVLSLIYLAWTRVRHQFHEQSEEELNFTLFDAEIEPELDAWKRPLDAYRKREEPGR